MATDLEEVSFACCEGSVWARGEEDVEGGGQQISRRLGGPVKVRPAAAAGGLVYRLQAGALRSGEQAAQLALRLKRDLSTPADSRFDAADGLYKVRVGRYATRDAAEEGRRSLAAAGVKGSFLVTEGSGLQSPGLALVDAEGTLRFAGRRVVLSSEGGALLSYRGTRYRGALEVYLNDRGSLNVINELSLEDYLRGVVPKEMGPELYPELEALKAQVVAARTYTLVHLGEFAGDGYDLCAGPRCHVYGGADAEHPLSDRAVRETAGQVMTWQRDLADTLYTATCGGHTESVEAIFPTLLGRPYLAPVHCLEAGARSLGGDMANGVGLESGLAQRLVPSRFQGDPRQDLETRLLDLARLAGLAAPADSLASLERREVQRFVASVFDLVLDARLFITPEEVPDLLRDPPQDWGPEALRQAAYLVASGLFDGSLEDDFSTAEADPLILRLALMLHVLREVDGRFAALDGAELVLRSGAGESRYSLSTSLASFRHRIGIDGRPTVKARPLELAAGDPVTVYLRAGELVAVVQRVGGDESAGARHTDRRQWRRFHSDAELAKHVEGRYPGLGFQRFEVLERGASGRAVKIRLFGRGGRTVDVQGLEVRWTLDVPETFFTVTRLTPEGGAAGWLFRGRGWGHGVGLCQEGAFGMARRGHEYREILEHYYLGARLGRLDSGGLWPLQPPTLPDSLLGR
ncbi:MAG: SpoIID/LytB domain-containing protein [Acidobacteriota bacterium]